MRGLKTKIFKSDNSHILEEKINDWFKKNEESISNVEWQMKIEQNTEYIVIVFLYIHV